MSETFDPDAWPQPSGKRPTGGSKGADNGRSDDFDEDEDDYDPLAFDDSFDMPPSSTRPPASTDHDVVGYEDQFGSYGEDHSSDVARRQQREYEDAFPPARRDDFASSVPTSLGDDDYDEDFSTTGREHGQMGYSTDFDNLYDDDDQDDYRDDVRQVHSQPVDDYDGYDDYDDEFDREPQQSGSKRKLLFPVVAAILILGVLGFAASQFLGGDDKTPTVTDPDGEEVSAEPAPAEVIEAVNKALEAWGEFAVDGNLDHVRPYFVNDGPQFDQFLVDAEELGQNPPGGAPLKFEMQDPLTYHTKENEWVFRGAVTGTRPKDRDQSFSWELSVIRVNERDPWRVHQVRPFKP